MKTKKIGNWLGSAYLSAVLIVGVGLMSVKLFRVHEADNAPMLADYNWSKHTKVVALLVPKGDCGCGMKPSEIARKAAEHGVDFVQISALPSAKTIKPNESKTGTVHTIDPQTFSSYCSDDHALALEIHSGRIISRVSGNLPNNYFDRFAS